MATARKSTRTEQLARLIPVFIVLFSVGYAIAAYAFLYIPKLGRLVPGGDLYLNPYNDRLTEATNYGRTLKNIQKYYDDTKPQLRERVQGMVPAGRDTQSLYPIIDAVARSSNLQLTSISVNLDDKVMTESGVQVVQVIVNVMGGNPKTLRAFLAALEKEQRIIDVDSVIFSSDADSYSINMHSYVMSPDRLTVPPPPATDAPPPDAGASP